MIHAKRWSLFAAVRALLFLSSPLSVWAADESTPSAAAGVAPTPEQADFFERQIRPVLANHCWKCHGEKKQEAGLRLDSRPAMLKGSDEQVVVVPGEPEKSSLVAAIGYDGTTQMPPDAKLPPEVIAALTAWVKSGAPWPESSSTAQKSMAEVARTHWAFQPMRAPVVPDVRQADWPRTPIDRFVLHALEQKQLSPAPAADRRTLARRAWFDLLGMPPSPEELVAFLADSAPDAWPRLIDRLLASPHYGERWGRYWLDVARYADNKGYVFFEEARYPWAYTYRDYVVRAFNEDLPYDRFIIEQLAADQLDLGSDQRPLAALGYLTVGDHFTNNAHDVLDDQIDVTTRGLLGLTVTCARCHDHKFDPIPQADYYSLYGVFRSSAEPTVLPLFNPPPATEEFQKFDAELQVRQGRLEQFVTKTRLELAASVRARLGEYLLAANLLRSQPRTDNFMLLVEKGDINPTMILRWQVYLEKSAREHDSIWAPWHAVADFTPADFPVRGPQALAQLAADPACEIHPLVRSVVLAPGATSLAEVATRYQKLFGDIDKAWLEQSQAAVARCEPPPAALADPSAESLRRVLYGDDAPATVPETLGWGFLALLPDRPTQGEFTKLLKEVETWVMTGPGAPPRAMVLRDTKQPYDPRIFVRGNPHRAGKPVPRQFLEVLSPQRQPFASGSGRLELARAIASPTNPLTARVLVNRVWLHHFGAGLVTTPSDFGVRSDGPSHPELLDHLATSFIGGGWSIKQLHRQIMTSSVYQQSSDIRDDARLIDPENRLLWRMNRRRLDFEALRDSLLVVSGALDRTVGGPSVELSNDGLTPRRTIYCGIDRLNVPGLLRTFDFPSPSASNPQRDRTTIPPQALFLMNSGFAMETARRLAVRPDVINFPEEPARITHLYAVALGREPTADELTLAHDFLAARPIPERWAQLAHALVMSNEFIFID